MLDGATFGLASGGHGDEKGWFAWHSRAAVFAIAFQARCAAGLAISSSWWVGLEVPQAFSSSSCNGSTTWIHQADVTITSTPYWLSVDLATRHVSLFRLDRQIMSAPAGVGIGQDPTPTGQYFVAFFEASPSPGYGPFILVTSAHSTTIANWEGPGDAVIGIHGPLGANSLIGTIGAYLSHGCIRLPIPDLVELRDVPAGSPISICG